uniref:Phytochromobilin:ferredoxin oxidoreductase n=1 Tax=Chenopodium quinoa TaxID=63459 RepID=A0A803N5Q7_CHEQI
MESLSINYWLKPNPNSQFNNRIYLDKDKTKIKTGTQVISALSYQKFVDFAVEETKRRTHLKSSPLQVLDFGIFPKAAFDLPIFCANFFSSSSMNIIVLDLNPLHDVITNREYKEKYYKSLMPLSVKYAELLPWGGKLTGESLRFFSPIVIWTRFTSSQEKHDILFDAFSDYYKTWLDLMEHAVEETAADQIMLNSEAQHKYLTWRAEKNLLRSFLFNGVDELGSKTFLDYFPEYKLDDGTLNEKRSIMGKSFENRPWDSRGELIDNC